MISIKYSKKKITKTHFASFSVRKAYAAYVEDEEFL